MKTFTASLFAVAVLISVAPASAVDGGGIFPFEFRRLELDNGLRAYLIQAGAPGQVAYVTLVRTGSRDEVEKGMTGFAHFFEHMMFRGTKKYPNFDGVTEKMGAARNASTSNDFTVYHLVAASEYLEAIVDLESDRFQNLDYDEAGFRTEAGAVLGEYQNSAASAFAVLDRATREAVFEHHTYRHQTIGFEADVRRMPEAFEYSLSFYRRFYRPENVVLVIAGDFDPAAAESLIRKYYSDWQPGYQAPEVPAEPPQTAPRERTVEYPGRTLPIVSVNWRAPAWSATDRQAVATEVLGRVGFGPNSAIYRRLVIEQQRVQFLNASFGLARDPAVVSLTAMVSDPADLKAVEAELLAAAASTRDQPVDPVQLQATKSNMKYGFLMGLETARGVAFGLIEAEVSTGGIEAIDDYYRTLEAVTAEDVQAAARAILADPGRTIVTLIQKGGGA